ncbi:MAG: TIM barrel protein [Actinobacteria bacterium]|nr:TIM barrel protein [Actinomycetota bacterium]
MHPPHDIGVSTSAYSEQFLPAALEQIAAAAPSAEIRSFGMHTLLSKRNQRAALASGLPCSVHGPFGYKGLGDVSEAARLEALDEHRRHYAAAAEIGATLYLVHPDWRPEPGPRDPAVVGALERSFDTLRELRDETGVPIVVENMPGVGHSHLTAPGDLDLRGLGFALDVGHASISGTLDAFLAAPPPEWRHVHLHSNAGFGDHNDPHLPVGAGVVDAAVVLAAARAAGASVVLELNNAADVAASLASLRSRGLIT